MTLSVEYTIVATKLTHKAKQNDPIQDTQLTEAGQFNYDVLCEGQIKLEIIVKFVFQNCGVENLIQF